MWVNGKDTKEIENIWDVRQTAGMVFQNPDNQIIGTVVEEDVGFGPENLGVPTDEIWERVEKSLNQVGMIEYRHHSPNKLSGGQKQRLALAGVLAMGADILVLDEPTANLDPRGRDEVINAVDRVCTRNGATLIVVEHRPKHWSHVVDTYYRLDADGLRRITEGELPQLPALPPAKHVPAGTPAAVSTQNLLTRFGPPRTVHAPEGFSTVITGENGSGKTTLVQVLAGLTPPKQGRVEYSDTIRQGLTKPSIEWASADLAQRIGYVFQEPEHQFVTATVREEMALSGAPQERIDDLLRRLRLTHLVDANPFTLSGGEKRRLSVATALVNAPKLLILDEPTFGQDDRTFVELVGLIRELTDKGVTVISITHDEAFIASLGDHTEHITAGER